MFTFERAVTAAYNLHTISAEDAEWLVYMAPRWNLLQALGMLSVVVSRRRRINQEENKL